MRLLPFRVTADDPQLEQLLNDVLAQIRANRLRSSPTVLVNESANGTSLDAVQRGTGGGGSPATVVELVWQKNFGDYFLAKDGGGKIYQVARTPTLRCSLVGSAAYGQTIFFSYPHNPASPSIPTVDPLAFMYRKATQGTKFQYEGIVPTYEPNGIVNAISANTGVVSVAADTTTAAGTAIKWLEIGPRYWCRFADQSYGT